MLPSALAHSLWFIALFYETLDYNYYTLFWVFGGQTPGKMVLRTKLVKADDTAFTYKDAFVRYWNMDAGCGMPRAWLFLDWLASA